MNLGNLQQRTEELFLQHRNKLSLRKVESGVSNFHDAEFDGSDHEDNT